jgi:thiol-disulfide isomerase/thioredoxin
MKAWQNLLGAIVLLVTGGGAATGAELGDPAGPLKVREWVKGGPIDLSAGRGKCVYLIEFWATWCPPCVRSIPHLSELQKKYGDRGLVVIGISIDGPQTVANVRPFVEKMGARMEYAVAIDDQGATSLAYMSAWEQDSIPYAFLVDRQGRVVWHDNPASTARRLERIIEKTLAGRFDPASARELETLRRTVRARAEEMLKRAQGGEGGKVREIGEELIRIGEGEPEILNDVAWTILTDGGIRERDLELALRMARAAYEGCNGQDAAIVDTYARALFDTGMVREAIEMQKKAIQVAEGGDEQTLTELRAALKRYEQRAAGR